MLRQGSVSNVGIGLHAGPQVPSIPQTKYKHLNENAGSIISLFLKSVYHLGNVDIDRKNRIHHHNKMEYQCRHNQHENHNFLLKKNNNNCLIKIKKLQMA